MLFVVFKQETWSVYLRATTMLKFSSASDQSSLILQVLNQTTIKNIIIVTVSDYGICVTQTKCPY